MVMVLNGQEHREWGNTVMMLLDSAGKDFQTNVFFKGDLGDLIFFDMLILPKDAIFSKCILYLFFCNIIYVITNLCLTSAFCVHFNNPEKTILTQPKHDPFVLDKKQLQPLEVSVRPL